jgi:uncharacterized membrane protein YeaQ/YmgE (transglycosylase-associated protein family)
MAAPHLGYACHRYTEHLMSIIAWIILGLIAGFVASKIVYRSGEGLVLDVILGIGGAVVGGWLFHILGMKGVTGLNLYSLVVATIGATVFLAVYHGLFFNRPSTLGIRS